MSSILWNTHYRLAFSVSALMLLLQLGISPVGHASEQNAVAVVDALRGTVRVIRANADKFEPIAVNSPIFRQDIIKTEPKSKVRLKFRDDSLVSLGADSTMKVSKFIFSTEQKKRSSFFTIPEGIFRIVVKKFMPNSRVEVQTATAVSAVRGTDWLGLASPWATAIFVARGVVSVKSGNRDIGGEVILEKGEGTWAKLDKSLTSKEMWDQAMVDVFVNRTSLDPANNSRSSDEKRLPQPPGTGEPSSNMTSGGMNDGM